PLFLSMTCVQLAGALHRERDCLKILAPCALVNIVLNGFVIPHYGALGAAWTTVVTECLAAACLLALILSATRKPIAAEKHVG
ncbi:MAG: polysaccharide biosynthesis C-terminal domain-containing protein, partial [Pseudomonadota bacterium]